MEKLVTIVSVGVYAERQYQKQDGSQEYYRSRGIVMKRGGDRQSGVLPQSWNRDEAWWRQLLWRADRRAGFKEP